LFYELSPLEPFYKTVIVYKCEFILWQIYGDGKQTRSFQYVTDLVDGLVALMNSNFSLPVNLGNPDEHTVAKFAEIIKKIVGECCCGLVCHWLLLSDIHACPHFELTEDGDW